MSTPRYVFFQGEFVPYDDAKISVLTHGFNYGTGCFEGIRAYWNAGQQELFVRRLADHTKRLHKSARILGLAVPYSADELNDIALELLRRNEFQEDVYLRPLLYLADEKIGVKLHDLTPALTFFAVPMGDYVATGGLRAGVSSWRRLDDGMVPARAKITGAYINSALAKTEAYRNGFDEAIFLDSDGHVSEGSAMNIFLVRDGQLLTPGVNQNILEGITRASVMELAKQELGLVATERPIDRTELYVADEVFLTGTAAQIAPVTSIDHRAIGDTGEIGPVTTRIQQLFGQAVRGELPAYRHWLSPVYKSAATLV